MSTTTHPFRPEEIMALLDGELAAELAVSIRSHIRNCSECQSIEKNIQETSRDLCTWKVCSMAATIESRIRGAVAKSPSSPVVFGSEFFLRASHWTRKPWLGGLAAAFTAAALLLSIGSRLHRPKSREAVEIAGAQRRETALFKTVPVEETESSEGVDPETLSGANGELKQQEPPAWPPPPLGRPRSSGSAAWEAPMIARVVSLALVVTDFNASHTSLEAILARHHGYAATLNVATPPGTARTLQASLRIPAAQLAAALSELKALGRVEVESQNGEELTQQHADLAARLKNSRETEQRLQAILLQRTGKISDILSVEQEIARVRGEIEQMEAEQETLEHRVNFATVDLKLAEEYQAQLSAPAPSLSTQLRNAAVNGFRSAFLSLLALVLFLAESVPTLLVWLVILALPAWLLWRRYQRFLVVARAS